MNLFFGNLFWGLLLVLWGASLILKTFNINMPLAKIFFAVVIILFGIKLLVGDRITFLSSKRSKPRGSSYIRSNRSGDYTLVFSGGTIDLRDLQNDSKDLEITVVFGSADVILPSHINFDIESTAVFGQNVVPKGNPMASPGDPVVRIESTAVFGQIEYRYEVTQRDTARVFTEEPSEDF